MNGELPMNLPDEQTTKSQFPSPIAGWSNSGDGLALSVRQGKNSPFGTASQAGVFLYKTCGIRSSFSEIFF